MEVLYGQTNICNMNAHGLWYVAHAFFGNLLCLITYDNPRGIGRNYSFMDADVKVLKSLKIMNVIRDYEYYSLKVYAF